MADQIMTRSQHRKNNKKKKSIVPKVLLGLLAVLLIIGLFQIPKLLGVLGSFDTSKLPSASEDQKYMSILILGLDNDGGSSLETGHTDSITYVAANLETKQSIALPIYRDANVFATCLGQNENINRIYSAGGIDCLTESVHQFLDLPLDYYAVITFDGFIQIANELGYLNITPYETFTSNYGQDKKVEYYFEAGVPTEMHADMLMAYLRYRGGSSGENRANRQVQLLQAIKNRCFDSLLQCYNDATPHFPGAIKTNVPILKLTGIADIFSSNFELQSLEVIGGENVQTESGWTQVVNEEDKHNKVQAIRDQIFV